MNQLIPTANLVPTPVHAVSPIEGQMILDRVRVAMSRATLEDIEPHLIRPMAGQPRKTFNENRLQMLAASILSTGQMMPGIIRRIIRDSNGCQYELCDGERRLKAVLLGGVSTYRALVINIDDEAAQYVVSIISNFNRDGHTLLELIDAVVKMHENLHLTIADIAKNVSLSAGYTQNVYGLRRLAPEVRDMLDGNLSRKTLPSTVAMEISGLPHPQQILIARRVMSGEVQSKNIRREVTSVSKAYGIPVREYRRRSFNLRRSIEVRIETLNISVKDLVKLLNQPGPDKNLHVWSSATIRSLKNSLEQSAKNLVEAHEIFERLDKIKQ